jgi:hypothetical protein
MYEVVVRGIVFTVAPFATACDVARHVTRYFCGAEGPAITPASRAIWHEIDAAIRRACPSE